MNVLVVYTGTREQELVPILDIFESLGIPAELCKFTEDLESGIGRFTSDFTHMLFVPTEAQYGQNPAVSYLCGYFQAKNNRIIIFMQNGMKVHLALDHIIQIKVLQNLKEYYRELLSEWQKQEKIDKAIIKLKNQGITFSGESFFKMADDGSVKACEYFVQAGMSVNMHDSKGVSLLSHAVRSRHLSVVEFLLSEGADVNVVSADRGNTPLMDACSDNNEAIFDCLLEAGADINLKNKNSQTALILAVGSKSEIIAEKLINSGADVNIRDSLGMTVRDYTGLFGIMHIFGKNNEE